MESTMTNSSILIATLGSEAQVITLTLELLLAQSYNISELVVVHTLHEQEPVRSALGRLHEFFGESRREAFLFRTVMIGAPEPIADLVTEDEVGALFRPTINHGAEKWKDAKAP